MENNKLTPRAKIGDVCIYCGLNTGLHMLDRGLLPANVTCGRQVDDIKYRSTCANCSMDNLKKEQEDILKNLTTDVDYTEEVAIPKRWMNAGECPIHPGSAGHNC